MNGASRRGFLRRLVFGSRDTSARLGPRSHRLEACATAPDADSATRTLVCIFLRGGADTLNMLVPFGDDNYYRNRPTLSIRPPGGASDSAIKLTDFYGLHPRMKPLEPIFHAGRLGMVQAVGSDNPTGSHFEAQDQIEHGESYGHNLGGGWLGRYLRARAGGNPLAGVAIGPTLPESLRGAPAACAFHSVDEVQLPITSGSPGAVSQALSLLYGAEVGVIGRQGQETLDLLARVEQLRGRPYQPQPGAEYPGDDFGAGLREVARLVRANLGLAVACLDLGSWDTHFFQGATGGLQATLIDQLSRGLAAFDADLRGLRDRVTTIVMTEFGRRLYENGSAGTDHGRGFAFFAMGDGINGGRIHGTWPGLTEEPMLPGPGGMEVKIDYRAVLAEILSRPAGGFDLQTVFPGFNPDPVGIA